MLMIEKLRKEMPKVGDILMRAPYLNSHDKTPEELECTVTYVNMENLWYQVEFNIKGRTFKQCYVFPDKHYLSSITA